MNIENLINKIKTLPDCVVYPPSGIPKVNKSHTLPDDVLKFYELCGGVVLYEKADYPVLIVPPQDFVLANPVIVGSYVKKIFHQIGIYVQQTETVNILQSI
ncbi:Antitoxin YokJ [Parageobacillus caldoxylosilyticus]|nr:Antitoxin YokJ [Parageobacillus caldoxylosilyticus]